MEARLRTAANTFRYPPTPDVAASVLRRIRSAEHPARLRPAAPRRWATAAIVASLALAALLSVPQVRAGLLDVIQIGVIRILLAPPTPAPPPERTATRPPQPTPTPLTSVLDIAGETTLSAAQQSANFSLRLPAYPPGLGPPDHVFVQDMNGFVVVMVWVDPGQPDAVILSLHQLGPGTYAAEKIQPTLVATAEVGGRPALWTEGPYLLFSRSGDLNTRRLVEGHVLIWEDGGITYRVETDLPLDEALKIAESLR